MKQPFLNEDDFFKSTTMDEGGDLRKARKMPVGTISKGYKKIAEGKWVPVKKGGEKKTQQKLTEQTKAERIKMFTNLAKEIQTVISDAVGFKVEIPLHSANGFSSNYGGNIEIKIGGEKAVELYFDEGKTKNIKKISTPGYSRETTNDRDMKELILLGKIAENKDKFNKIFNQVASGKNYNAVMEHYKDAEK